MLRAISYVFALASASLTMAAEPIAYVPADTPYVLTSLRPLPPALGNKMDQGFEAMVDFYGKVIRATMTQKFQADGKPPIEYADQVFDWFGDLSAHMVNAQALADAGFKPQAKVAFYGVGLVPVLRVELGDEAKVQALIAAYLKRVVALSQSTVDGKPSKGYQLQSKKFRNGYLSRIGAAGLQVALLVEQGQLAITVIPKDADADVLNALFPAKPPAHNALEKITALQGRYRLQTYGIGYIDLMQIAQSYLGRASKLEKRFAQAIDSTIFAQPPNAVCEDEIGRLVGNAPRLVFGFGAVDAKQFEQHYIWEIKPQLAKQLRGATTEFPAYGQGKVAKIAVAVNTLEFTGLMGTHAQTVVADAYKCNALQPLNALAQKIQQGVSEEALGAYSLINGIALAVDKLDMRAQLKSAYNVAVISQEPEFLQQILATAAPEFAEMNLEVGQAPKALPEVVLAKLPVDLLDRREGYIAINETMAIAGLGSDRLPSIQQALKTPVRERGVVLEIDFAAPAIREINASVERALDRDSKYQAQEKLEMKRLLMVYFEQLLSSTTTMALTADGLEIKSTTRYLP